MSLNGVRIARVSTVPFVLAMHLRRQIASLVSAGAGVTLIASDGPELATFGGSDSLRCEVINIPRAFSPFRDLRALLALVRAFRRGRFDIVHSTTPKAGLLTALAGWAARVPVRLHTFTGQPWVELKGPMRWAAMAADWLIGRLNTYCYTDSKSQLEYLVASGVIRRDRIGVLGEGSLAGVDLRRFDPARFPIAQRQQLRKEAGLPPDAGIVLFVGRIAKDKGVLELLEAIRIVNQSGKPAVLLLVGPLDQEKGGAGLISKDDLVTHPDVRYLGYTQEPERYMAIADLLCLPSYREGFGTVVIEAGAMGLPAVGTEIYGLSDAIVDGVTGVLVPPRDAPALANALRVLLEDEARRRQMGVAARNRVTAHFDADILDHAQIGEYRRLLAEAGRNVR